jgi:hypothetical protein
MKKYNVIIEHAVSFERNITETIVIEANNCSEAMNWAKQYSSENNFRKLLSVCLAN